jgi:hypothetical protein
MRRRMVDTAQQSDRQLWEDLAARTVSVAALYRSAQHRRCQSSQSRYVPAAPVVSPGKRAFFTEVDHCVATWNSARWTSGWTSTTG